MKAQNVTELMAIDYYIHGIALHTRQIYANDADQFEKIQEILEQCAARLDTTFKETMPHAHCPDGWEKCENGKCAPTCPPPMFTPPAGDESR